MLLELAHSEPDQLFSTFWKTMFWAPQSPITSIPIDSYGFLMEGRSSEHRKNPLDGTWSANSRSLDYATISQFISPILVRHHNLIRFNLSACAPSCGLWIGSRKLLWLWRGVHGCDSVGHPSSPQDCFLSLWFLLIGIRVSISISFCSWLERNKYINSSGSLQK